VVFVNQFRSPLIMDPAEGDEMRNSRDPAQARPAASGTAQDRGVAHAG
jgi:hypothetical protein